MVRDLRLQNPDLEKGGGEAHIERVLMFQGHHNDAQPVYKGSEDRRVSWGLRRGGMWKSGLIVELGSIIYPKRWAERV